MLMSCMYSAYWQSPCASEGNVGASCHAGWKQEYSNIVEGFFFSVKATNV